MNDRNFTKVPNELFQLYTQIPGFTGEHVLMYTVLLSYYNDEYGYAYPDQVELRKRLNCGINKVGRLAKKLKDVGLIDYKRRYAGGNYVYYVKQPIKDERLFYERFSEIRADVDDGYAEISEWL